MRIGRLLAVLMAVGLAVALAGPAAAEETPACSGETVSGVVIAVDEATGQVTIAVDGGGLCTVTLSGEYDYPIVSLLGAYFGDVTAARLTAALEVTQTWVVCESDTCTLAEEGAEGAAAAIVVGITENGDGAFTLLVMTEGSETPVAVVIDDANRAQAVSEALEDLVVEWELQDGEDGSVHIVDIGDAIAAYHEGGLGFGVLVKLYGIAAEAQQACQAGGTEGACGVDVQALIRAFQSGTGLGELFREYGRPSILGLGHVGNAQREIGAPEDAGQSGLCTARAHGGNANANGRGPITCPAQAGPEPVGGD